MTEKPDFKKGSFDSWLGITSSARDFSLGTKDEFAAESNSAHWPDSLLTFTECLCPDILFCEWDSGQWLSWERRKTKSFKKLDTERRNYFTCMLCFENDKSDIFRKLEFMLCSP